MNLSSTGKICNRVEMVAHTVWSEKLGEIQSPNRTDQWSTISVSTGLNVSLSLSGQSQFCLSLFLAK